MCIETNSPQHIAVLRWAVYSILKTLPPMPATMNPIAMRRPVIGPDGVPCVKDGATFSRTPFKTETIRKIQPSTKRILFIFHSPFVLTTIITMIYIKVKLLKCCLDAANTSRGCFFFDDFEGTELSGVCDVWTAAEFARNRCVR